ncbi:capsule biosynthesis protein [Pseudoruegeria sp. HB172150]|uniref:capsule biosynthesis protein n=1 Tax=Pseudoruegeria sp. HB172150 TaxID=2721164 RepID=UPI0015518C72|nr:capsule biosynthesis protein [Pseudoruegeria sp. HB172150]
MTTKPKAKKFRIRRVSPLPGNGGAVPAAANSAAAEIVEDDDMLFAESSEGSFNDGPLPATRNDGGEPEISTPQDLDDELELTKIRKEGLTGRQLRMARRVAQKHGLAPVSDFDAVRLLRKQGIDPFERANMLELVVPGTEPGGDRSLPQTVERPQLPSVEVRTPDERAGEILRMQRDIARRRRRRLLQLVARLAFFVLIPTLIAGWYFYRIATPMYSTHSEFVIQKAQNPAAGGSGLASMFSGTSLATSQDSVAVQGYLQSMDAMLRLDEDLGFIEHFSNPEIDPLQRLETDATREQAYRAYKKRVKISYDPTEGIIKMDVTAANPDMSEQFAEKLIQYAEEQVDSLSLRLRGDQMQGARDSYEEAEASMFEAQQKVLELQEKLGVLDPVTEQQGLMSQITGLETQLAEKRLELSQLLDNARPNQARVDGVQGDVDRLENLIAELRSQLTVSNSNGQSLARITGELRLAERELQTRELMMQAALQQMETARIEANRQTRYLETAVSPVRPDEPSYPRAFENTILAFLIFGGIYLMVSLTVAVLKEQISS